MIGSNKIKIAFLGHLVSLFTLILHIKKTAKLRSRFTKFTKQERAAPLTGCIREAALRNMIEHNIP